MMPVIRLRLTWAITISIAMADRVDAAVQIEGIIVAASAAAADVVVEPARSSCCLVLIFLFVVAVHVVE